MLGALQLLLYLKLTVPQDRLFYTTFGDVSHWDMLTSNTYNALSQPLGYAPQLSQLAMHSCIHVFMDASYFILGHAQMKQKLAIVVSEVFRWIKIKDLQSNKFIEMIFELQLVHVSVHPLTVQTKFIC